MDKNKKGAGSWDPPFGSLIINPHCALIEQVLYILSRATYHAWGSK